jgi:hypothetical protein
MTDRIRAAAAASIIALLAIGCGGGTPPGSAGSSAGAGASEGGGGGTATGEPYDDAIVTAAADVLATADSYTYDGVIVQTGGSGPRTQAVTGTVRTSPEAARSVIYTEGDDAIKLLFADGKDFADYGTGYQPVAADAGTREETDPLSIRTLYGSFAGHARDFVVAGKETINGIPTVHLVLDPDELADQRESIGEGAEGWVAELWLAEADGQLVRAIWGGPQAPPPASFGQPNYTIEVTDIHCDCPVDVPA